MTRMLRCPNVLCLGAAALLATTLAMVQRQPAQDPADQPGPIHARLAKCAGEWDSETKFTMDPKQPPMEMAGSARAAMLLDGRYLQMEESGEMMGQPYTSLKIYGYNSGAKRAEAIWMWTNGTGMMVLGGEAKDGGKSLELSGGAKNASGEESFAVTVQFVSDDQFVVTLRSGEGPEGASWATTYTRKKAGAGDAAK